MDLFNDLRSILIDSLKTYGVKVPDTPDTWHVLHQYINMRSKLIDPYPRTVYYSKEITTQHIDEPYKRYLKEIKEKFEEGKDINPFLSKGALRPQDKDWLLYDWKIHHLHLSGKVDGDYFYKRSSHLLFCMVFDTEVYFIKVLPHGQDHVFAHKELLAIVRRNWPHLLEPYKTPFTAVTPSLSEKETDRARRSGSFTFTEIDGEVFAMIGGGITTAGTNIMHMKEADEVFKIVEAVEKTIKESESDIRKEMTERGIIPPEEFNIKLVMHDGQLVVTETNSGEVVGEMPINIKFNDGKAAH